MVYKGIEGDLIVPYHTKFTLAEAEFPGFYCSQRSGIVWTVKLHLYCYSVYSVYSVKLN